MDSFPSRLLAQQTFLLGLLSLLRQGLPAPCSIEFHTDLVLVNDLSEIALLESISFESLESLISSSLIEHSSRQDLDYRMHWDLILDDLSSYMMHIADFVPELVLFRIELQNNSATMSVTDRHIRGTEVFDAARPEYERGIAFDLARDFLARDSRMFFGPTS